MSRIRNEIVDFEERTTRRTIDPAVDVVEPSYVRAGVPGDDGNFSGFYWETISDDNGGRPSPFASYWNFSYEDAAYRRAHPGYNKKIQVYRCATPEGKSKKLALFKPYGGKGVILLDDGDAPPDGAAILRDDKGRIVYIGSFRNGVRSGLGSEFRYVGGAVPVEIEGYWENGVLVRVRDGDRLAPLDGKPEPGELYSGEIDEEGRPSGEGKKIYPNGEIYSGGWKNGKRDGAGTLSFNRRTIYSGQWREGKRCGSGIGDIDGGYYDGEWKDDVRSGEGKWVCDTGKAVSVSGKWENDVPVGEAIITDFTNYYSQKQYRVELDASEIGGKLGADKALELVKGLPCRISRMGYACSLNGCARSEGNYSGCVDPDIIPNGYGEWTGRDFVYKGEWTNGSPEGEGELTYASGIFGKKDSIKGVFYRGKPHGECLRVNGSTGLVQKCVYDDGRIVRKRNIANDGLKK